MDKDPPAASPKNVPMPSHVTEEVTEHGHVLDYTEIRAKLADVGDAISHVLQFAGSCHRVLFVNLRCNECDQLYKRGSKDLSLVDDGYYDELGKDTHCWPVSVVKTFGWLKAHEKHNPDIIFDDFDVTKPSPGPVAVQTLPSNVRLILSVAVKNNTQYVVVEINPDNRLVLFYDGSSTKDEDLEQWVEHVDQLLSRYGMSRADEGMRWILRHHKLTDFIPEMRFKGEDERDRGPVACRVLWQRLAPCEIDKKYGITTGTRSGRVSRAIKDYSKICMNEMKVMIKSAAGSISQKRTIDDGEDRNDEVDNQGSKKKVAKRRKQRQSS